MIITSIAAALLAAVTGMTTVRVPGGNEQQVSVVPNYVCEVTVAKLVDGKDLFVANASNGFGKKGPKIDLSHYTKAERNAFEKTAKYMGEILCDRKLTPSEVTIYRMYSLEEQAIRPAGLNTNIPEYTEYVFKDEFERTVTFIDTKDNRIDELELNDTFIHIDTNLNQGPTNHVTGIFLDHLIGIGLDDLYWGRYYGMWSVIGEGSVTGHIDTSTIDLSGMNQVMLGGFWGYLLETDPFMYYWFRFNWMLTTPIFDTPVYDAQSTELSDLAMNSIVNCGNYNFAACPMAGTYAHFALERSDVLLGRTTLKANAVNRGLATLQGMSYDDLIQQDNLSIID